MNSNQILDNGLREAQLKLEVAVANAVYKWGKEIDATMKRLETVTPRRYTFPSVSFSDVEKNLKRFSEAVNSYRKHRTQ